MSLTRKMVAGASSILRGRVYEPIRVQVLARREPDQLRRVFPSFHADRQQLEVIGAEYRHDYDSYVSQVSSPRAAASMETLSLIVAIMRSRKLRRVVDLGSGFSTYVMRREADRLGIEHVAVDHDVMWLEKTREFLASRQLSPEGIYSWDEFLARPELRDFDLVLHDLGGSQLRTAALPEVERRVAEGGWLMIDDMHKPHMYPEVLERMRSRWHVVPLAALTIDDFGRFCALCRRKA